MAGVTSGLFGQHLQPNVRVVICAAAPRDGTTLAVHKSVSGKRLFEG
jgi:hypothetical protein